MVRMLVRGNKNEECDNESKKSVQSVHLFKFGEGG